MKTKIDILSDREVEIGDYAESQNGTMDFVTEKLSAEGIFYQNSHHSSSRQTLPGSSKG